MNEKHINKSLCESDSTKNPPPCEVESQISHLPQHEGRLGVGIIPQGYKQTSIGIIPQDWEVVRLGEVCLVQSGGTPPKNEKSYWENGTIKWLGSSVCKNLHYVDEITDYITQKGLDNSSAKIFKQGTTLIALVGATIGKIAYLNFDASTNQNIAGIYPQNEKVLNHIFLFYVSLILYKEFEKLSSDKFKMANLSFIKSLQIPLPPLKEQEKIARILGVWDSAIDLLANLIKAKRKYKTALMQRLLTPPRYTTSCHTDTLSCHTERSEVSKNKGVELQSNAVCLDTSAFSKPQYDKVLDSCNDTPLCHTASSFCHTDALSCHTSPSCHTEGVARSIQKDDLQGNDICLDSSLSAKAQNDKEKNAENGREINPQNDKENTHNDKKKIRESSLRFAGFSDKWQEFRLGDLLQYEQPTKYIVKNTEYSDSYQTPVLTAGKSFILGKTNETFGIYDDLPIILFDDFMATSQFVDFPFKVKSSASKILKAKNNSVNLRVVFEVMQMIDFCAENHKRYWISEYQNLKIKLPTLAEQKKIAQILSVCDKEIETLNLKFECLKAQKRGLMQQLLSGKVRVKC